MEINWLVSIWGQHWHLMGSVGLMTFNCFLWFGTPMKRRLFCLLCVIPANCFLLFYEKIGSFQFLYQLQHLFTFYIFNQELPIMWLFFVYLLHIFLYMRKYNWLISFSCNYRILICLRKYVFMNYPILFLDWDNKTKLEPASFSCFVDILLRKINKV